MKNREFVRNRSLSEVAAKSLLLKRAIARCCQKIGQTGLVQRCYVLAEEQESDQELLENVDYLAQTVKSMLWTVKQFKSTNVEGIYATLENAGTIYI